MEIQQSDERASYGNAVLDKLSDKLTAEFDKDFSSKKFTDYEKILFNISNLANSVFQIELATLFRINKNRIR